MHVTANPTTSSASILTSNSVKSVRKRCSPKTTRPLRSRSPRAKNPYKSPKQWTFCHTRWSRRDNSRRTREQLWSQTTSRATIDRNSTRSSRTASSTSQTCSTSRSQSSSSSLTSTSPRSASSSPTFLKAFPAMSEVLAVANSYPQPERQALLSWDAEC